MRRTMTSYLKSITEFLALAGNLEKSPEDPRLKHSLLERLPAIKAQAKTNPMALYGLAKLHPENSGQYQKMMRQSADLGCGNAMLALCKMHLTGNNPKAAARYLEKINASNDSFMKQCARDLAAEYPALGKAGTARVPQRFFQEKVAELDVGSVQLVVNP